MEPKNQKLTSHTLKRVKALGFYLADRTVYTRLDIMALNMGCSSRQIRRYLIVLKEKFSFHFIQKPQGYKIVADRSEVLNRLEAYHENFDVFNNLGFTQTMLQQG
ncbi:MAG: hypothetical protein ACKOWQ_06895 [Aquirufa sp.]